MRRTFDGRGFGSIGIQEHVFLLVWHFGSMGFESTMCGSVGPLKQVLLGPSTSQGPYSVGGQGKKTQT